ncbi:hypothetical protein SUDANB58_02977 [Streptomyces sp. enrichment culture]|uniref:DUF4232 domain-containing protein n=1 Tax=Streptomyces sp. enrichment culture TaxID=1795815 RepID=UPI003F544E46
MRTPLPLTASGALAAVLLLGACGAETAVPGGGGETGDDGGSTARTCGTSASPDPGPGAGAQGDAGERDGVRIVGEPAPGGAGSPTGAGPVRCAVAYTVTNREAEPFTYTITFSFLSGRGAATANTTETVGPVEAGRTVRRTLGTVFAPGAHDAGSVRVVDVKRVPSDEAPAPAGPCPSSGLRLTADEGEAAMGLRVVGLRLRNCGSRPYSLDGYPLLGLLDEDHDPVGGIEIVRGGGDIALVPGFDAPPRPVTLDPGESASAGLMWRNTTGFGAPVAVPYVRVRARAGAAPVMVAPDLDLGTTGRLGVSAWREEAADGRRPVPPGP